VFKQTYIYSQENNKMSHTIISSNSITKPKVEKAKAADDVLGDNNIHPLGIRLTGGLKLRKNNLTEKGVRVAVIDGGVDAEHPDFNGRVTTQMWFRAGSPLSEDNHGTHVAGTIHMMAPGAEIYDDRVFGKDGIEVGEAITISIY
jgi:subtilisin family serine protease